MSNEPNSAPSSRRAFLAFGAVASAAVSASRARPVAAHNLPSGQFGSVTYDRALLADSGYRAVFQSPHVEAAVQPPNTKHLDHLLLAQIKNWLNGFQFSYKARPEELHVVVATYASANLLTYGDAVWQKYRLGEKYKITDPETGTPAVRNLFWHSRFGPSASTDPDQPESIWQDAGIEALQKRGAVFLTWHQTVDGHAGSAVADGRAPQGMKPADVRNDIQANLIPGATLIPAMVGEVTRLQQHGYTLVFVPAFRP